MDDGDVHQPRGGATCPFEKVIATRSCGCRSAARAQIAEREAIRCTDLEAQSVCVRLLGLLVKNGAFALRQTAKPAALPNAQALKIQRGGLLGLQRALDPHDDRERVDNIRALVDRALVRYKALSALPFPEIVREVSRTPARKRARARRQ